MTVIGGRRTGSGLIARLARSDRSRKSEDAGPAAENLEVRSLEAICENLDADALGRAVSASRLLGIFEMNLDCHLIAAFRDVVDDAIHLAKFRLDFDKIAL